MNRRRILAAVLATSIAALAVPVTAAEVGSPQAATAVSTQYRVVLPKPTGPYAIGKTDVHLTDARRADPWRPGQPRELMVSVWYPTRSRTRDKPCNRRHPVLLYSPAAAVSRVAGTSQAEELASHGYVVVTIDHTGEAPVEFPGGRVVGALVPWNRPGTVKKATDTRVADVRFVLDALPGLPRRLRTALDLGRIGIFGDSTEASTAAAAVPADPRIDVRAPRQASGTNGSAASARHALVAFFGHFLKP